MPEQCHKNIIFALHYSQRLTNPALALSFVKLDLLSEEFRTLIQHFLTLKCDACLVLALGGGQELLLSPPTTLPCVWKHLLTLFSLLS